MAILPNMQRIQNGRLKSITTISLKLRATSRGFAIHGLYSGDRAVCNPGAIQGLCLTKSRDGRYKERQEPEKPEKEEVLRSRAIVPAK
jgi:hypothetical protein